jgi:hypothetical protein
VAAKKINLMEAGAEQGDISEKFQDLRREVMLMRFALHFQERFLKII